MVKSYRPASTRVLPAMPGTYLVTAYFDDGQVELVKFNVNGWSISSGRTVLPVVLDPRLTDEEIEVYRPPVPQGMPEPPPPPSPAVNAFQLSAAYAAQVL